MKKWMQIRFFLCVAILFGVVFSLQNVSAQENRTVKVGLFELGQFCYLDDNGNPRGYAIDYMNEIKKRANWNIEYVPVEDWNAGMEMIESGKIDLLAPAQMTAERVDQYRFSAYSMGSECGAIFVLDQIHGDIAFEEYDKMEDLTFGIGKGSIFEADYRQLCQKLGMEENLVSYDTTYKMLQALEDGEIDGAIADVMFSTKEYKTLERFSMKPVYYIGNLEDNIIMDELDDAMAKLYASDTNFQTNLLNEYFGLFSNNELTYEEQQFVEECPVIKVGYEQNKLPLSYTDENGEFAGITRDIFDEISRNSGLTFEYLELPAGTVTYEYLVEHGISVLANVENNDVNLNLQTMKLSETYLETE
ncbi:MAG: transporter substrate-binding domain-containing protein, partial [Lachnospiraceae bacterium]|nr:transporter substrate-binding domain-containing protein [Lachnospiraceae bacterium]